MLANPSHLDILSAMTTPQTEPDLYVEYLSQATGEPEFILGETKWQYCWCRYSDGRRDLGVYSFAGDLCYGYQAFRAKFNLN
jgi:hypothetical protein